MTNKYKTMLENWIEDDQRMSEMVKNWLLEWANKVSKSSNNRKKKSHK